MSFQESSSIQLETAVLVRTRDTASQTGLTRPSAAGKRARALPCSAGKSERPQHPDVDDVMTTGTTAAECARVLRRAGAKEVFVATVARATKEVGSVLARAASAFAGGTQGHA